MKLYKLKAILYPLVSIAHIVFHSHLPCLPLTVATAAILWGLGAFHIARWVEKG